MARQVRYNGRVINVPDDATDDEIAEILSATEAAPAAAAPPPAAPQPKKGWGVRTDKQIAAALNAPGARATFPEELDSTPERALAAADLAASFGSQSAGTIAGGLAGIAGTLYGIPASGDAVDYGVKAQNAARDFVSWGPQTAGGQRIVEDIISSPGIQKAIQTVGPPAAAAAEWLRSQNAKAGPLRATIIETVLLGAPELLTGGRLSRAQLAFKLNTPQVRNNLEQAAARLQIDLTDKNIRKSVLDAAEALNGGATRESSGIDAVGAAVLSKKEAAKKEVNAAFADARSKDAFVSYQPIRDVADRTFEELRLRGANFKQSPHLMARLEQLRKLDTEIPGLPDGKNARPVLGGTGAAKASRVVGPDGKPLVEASEGVGGVRSPITLNELEIINQGLSRDIRTVGRHTPEGADLVHLRRNLTEMLDNEFMNNMILGDPAAKAKWARAQQLHTKFKKRFHEDKIIAKLANEQLGPTETARLIIGLSETKMKPEASRTVRKLRALLGESSPEFQAISDAYIADMMAPLFDVPEPDAASFRKVAARIHMKRRHQSDVIRQLGISDSDLEIIQRAAKAASTTVIPKEVDPRRWMAGFFSRFLAGHHLARRSFLLKTLNTYADKVLGVGQKTHEQLLREFVGAQLADAPVLRPDLPNLAPVVAHAALLNQMQAEPDDAEEEDNGAY